MKKTKIAFKDVYEYCKNNDQKALAKKSPVHEVLLNMVIKHVPIPKSLRSTVSPPYGKGIRNQRLERQC